MYKTSKAVARDIQTKEMREKTERGTLRDSKYLFPLTILSLTYQRLASQSALVNSETRFTFPTTAETLAHDRSDSAKRLRFYFCTKAILPPTPHNSSEWVLEWQAHAHTQASPEIQTEICYLIQHQLLSASLTCVAHSSRSFSFYVAEALQRCISGHFHLYDSRQL